MKETQKDFGLLDQAAAAAAGERSLETAFDAPGQGFAAFGHYAGLDRPPVEFVAVEPGGCAPPVYVAPRPVTVRGEPWAIRGGLPAVITPPQPGLPTDPKARKQVPVYTGFVKFFPRAILAQSHLSYVATAQHHPDKGVHWDHSKSTDHLDCLMRHMIDDVLGVTVDTDKIAHKTKVAWRANADLEMELRRAAGL